MKRFSLLLLLFLAACSPKDQARWDADASFNLGGFPSDVCLIDGKPQILSVTMDESDIQLAYIRKDGDVVMANYLRDVGLGTSLHKAGSFYWQASFCSNETRN